MPAVLKKSDIYSQGESLSNRWTEGRSTVNPLEFLNLRGNTAERKNRPALSMFFYIA